MLNPLPDRPPCLDISIPETRHFPETCWKLEQQWFWQQGFQIIVNAETIAKHIRTVHSSNAKFLLDVGPDKKADPRIEPKVVR